MINPKRLNFAASDRAMAAARPRLATIHRSSHYPYPRWAQWTPDVNTEYPVGLLLIRDSSSS